MALKTIKASGHMQAGMTIDIQCGSHHVIMDQPKTAGGADLGASPLEVMIATVAGCFGSIGRIVAHQQKLAINAMTFEVEADYDPSGLLGRETDARVGFQEIRLKVDIDAPTLDQAGKQAFLEEVERRCPVMESLLNGTKVSTALA